MQQVVGAFMQRHHFEPPFWLDKACVDQENIADGLRTLPVSVMACNIVLATCGSTCVNRAASFWFFRICYIFLAVVLASFALP